MQITNMIHVLAIGCMSQYLL